MIYGHLIGGFGNQLFCYAFGRMLQEHYGEPMVLCAHIGAYSDGRISGGVEELNIPWDTIAFVYNEKDFNRLAPWHLKMLRVFYRLQIWSYYTISPPSSHIIIRIMQPFINLMGFYCVHVGYCKTRYWRFARDKYFYGVFNTPCFFNSIKPILRKELRVVSPADALNQKYLDEISRCNAVCVHVRRGDFLDPDQSKKHCICSKEYYLMGMKRVLERQPDAEFFVFSDDLAWARENLIINASVHFVDANNGSRAAAEYRLMYSCKHFIISASTLSWWAQYIGADEDSIVVAPSWFYRHDYTQGSYYGKDWIVLEP